MVVQERAACGEKEQHRAAQHRERAVRKSSLGCVCLQIHDFNL
jgi:hypothetical protein